MELLKPGSKVITIDKCGRWEPIEVTILIRFYLLARKVHDWSYVVEFDNKVANYKIFVYQIENDDDWRKDMMIVHTEEYGFTPPPEAPKPPSF